MITTPFRFRTIGTQVLVTNEVGDYALMSPSTIDRFFDETLNADEVARFRELSIALESDGDWRLLSLMRRLRHRHSRAEGLTYLIVIPTLRCNLSCSYCQVSRAPLEAKGFDWDSEKLKLFERFIQGINSSHVKVEFQGGEPTLRADLLSEIMGMCRKRFSSAEFVVCTNLTEIDGPLEALYEHEDVYISTSIDGPIEVMTENRTKQDDVSRRVFNNFQRILKKYGPKKISALPTITDRTRQAPGQLIDQYIKLGFESIFLRPVNYMGFARKNFGKQSNDVHSWNEFYRQTVDKIIDVNKSRYFEEFYLGLLLRTIFLNQGHGYVDLRSPSHFAHDYCVVDFDGTLYPTDEARMLSRTRTIDLSIGSLEEGFNRRKVNELNANAMNQTNPDCIHCAYLPYCGIDIVDDISRYGRIDIAKDQTWYCQRQIALFDLIFERVIARDKRYLDVFLKWIHRGNNPAPTFELFHD